VSRRRYFHGRSYALARRCNEQRSRLLPSEEANQIVSYVLLLCCSRNALDLDVTAYCALTNHHHLVVTDRSEGGPDSKISKFCRDLHATIAKALNRLHEVSGAVWDPTTSFSDVEIHGFEAEVAQWVYAAGQAVAAGLVERPEDWPGVHWLPEDIGRTLTAERPEVLFSTQSLDPIDEEALREAQAELRRQLDRAARDDKKRGRSRRRRQQLREERERRAQSEDPPSQQPRPGSSSLPRRVSYTVPIPQCLREAGMSVEEARVYLREALDLYVARIHEDRAERGLGFLGVEALQFQDPHSPPPMTHVDTQHPARYQTRPRLATKSLPDEVVRELKNDLMQWEHDYDQELKLLLYSPTPHRARFPKGAHLRVQETRRLGLAYRAQAPPRAA